LLQSGNRRLTRGWGVMEDERRTRLISRISRSPGAVMSRAGLRHRQRQWAPGAPSLRQHSRQHQVAAN